MQRYYKPLFMFYGLVHLASGILFAVYPDMLTKILFDPVPPAAAAMIGLYSFIAGLGFFGGAFVNSAASKKMFLKLFMAANIANFALHLANGLQGYSSMGLVIGAGIAVPVFVYLAYLIHASVE